MSETIPDWPRIEAQVRSDGSGEVMINGTSYPVTAGDMSSARSAVLRMAAETASQVSRAVRVASTDPTGFWPLIVHPDGRVEPDPRTGAVPAAPEPLVEEPPTPPPASSTEAGDPLGVEAAAERPVSRRELRQSFLRTEQVEPPATKGVRGLLTRVGVRTAPSAAERAYRADVRAVSQHWPGVRTIAIVNGKGGASKTPTTALLSAVFARHSGVATIAWDNNETRGTLGWRTEQAAHSATILDLLPRVDDLLAPSAKAGDISHYVHHQAADKYDVLRSNPRLLSSEQRITSIDVDRTYDTLTRYYRLLFVDSGNDESAGHWLRMIDKADAIVVSTIAKPEHAEAGALLLEALAERNEWSARLAQQAVVIVSQAREKDADPSAAEIAKGFQGWVREVVTIPFDPAMVENVLHYDSLAPSTQRAWLRAGAALASGL